MATPGIIRHGRVAIETAILVAGIVAVKILVDALDGEFIELSPLYTSIVAGGIFVVGLIVAGTLADYKEAEKMPAEIVAALENILEDCSSIKQTKDAFDLLTLKRRLVAVVATFRDDLGAERSQRCLDAINDISASIVDLERLDVPPNYIVRLRTEQGIVRKNVLRIYHIQRTNFLPSAYLLIQTMVFLIIAALEFTQIEPLREAIVILALVSYFFIYLIRLLKIIDRPFQVREHTSDDVSIFLLTELAERLGAEC